jgi:hypothetical protein
MTKRFDVYLILERPNQKKEKKSLEFTSHNFSIIEISIYSMKVNVH